MLREYTTIQKTKLACMIEETGTIEKITAGESRYMNKQGAITELLEFTHDAKIKPAPGDYIIRQSDIESYLLKKEVFEKSYRPSGFKLI